MAEVTVGMITWPAEQAESLAGGMVGAGLAACVNILPAIRSLYHWEGALHNDAEALLLVKTQAARLPELSRHLATEHPYDVPEMIVLPIESGLPAYLDWVATQTGG